MACVHTPDVDGGRLEEVTQFGTTVSQLTALSAWLVERGVTLVGMEATGVNWKPVHWVLEDDIDQIWVINARHPQFHLICTQPTPCDLRARAPQDRRTRHLPSNARSRTGTPRNRPGQTLIADKGYVTAIVVSVPHCCQEASR